MKSKKKQKPKTRINIESWLARALTLAKSKSPVNWRINCVLFNAETKELVATNGHCMLIVKTKPGGTIVPFNLEPGLYEILDDVLLKREEEQGKEIKFPEYQSIIVESDARCSHNILYGIIICMIKQGMFVDIWKYENILKVLNKFSSDWIFTNVNENRPMMMEADTSRYNVKYIMMPTPM